VRRTSLHFLAQLSLARPHHRLEGVPPSGLIINPGSQQQQLMRPHVHTEEVRLVDDAFRRVCTRLQDPARQVRQLAAQILADLAQAVSEESLILTLEKTVMSDRQVRRSVLERSIAQTGASRHDRGRSNQRSSTRPSTTVSSLGTFNLIATGSSGAIISGLEDDYFEVRCATLSTVTHMASLSAQFAANCQDLLVDILTDDIQEVRLAAIRALGAVGDQVPLQSEQVAIITSALAEGSGRMRRRLHQLLSRCCLSSAPCLISLLDGLLHNLRRYPQDRDSIWRCAASVGRRHSVFVETCLSSLLRTHLWLSGPEPNWEDPAYLTVLLLVLNAEPGAPGMHAQFPRHLAATKVYLTELVPSLLPKRRHPFDIISTVDSTDRSLVGPSKRRRLELAHSELVNGTDNEGDTAASNSLLRFLHSLIRRVVFALNDLCRPFDNTATEDNNRPTSSLSRGLWNQRLTLLTRLVFADLCGSVQRLDRVGQWNGLIQWLTILTTLGWCLASVGACHSRDSAATNPKMAPSDLATNQVVSIMRKPGKLLSQALQMGLRALHLFSGKTETEQTLLVDLVIQLTSLNKLVSIEGFVTDMHMWARTVRIVVILLSQSVGLPADSVDECDELDQPIELPSISALHKSAKRFQPVYVALLQPTAAIREGASTTDFDVFGFGRAPMGTTSFANRLSEDADDGWAPASRVAADQSTMAIPEVRFTATIGTASIRVRAVIVGMNLALARKRVCVLFRRPDLQVNKEQLDATKSHNLWTALFHQWWPPVGAWHPLDEGFPTTNGAQSDHEVNRVELRTHLELSAGRWSDAGTVEIGLGFCLSSDHLNETSISGSKPSDSGKSVHMTVSQPVSIVPLIPRKMLARVKLLPTAPIGQW
ncbi:Integrator complex subunit 4, partial [Fasciola hepatica]